MKRIGIVVAAVALLPGCGLPVGVQFAILAIDGMTLAATEKTPSDHALSAIAEQDCAMWRPLKGDPICSDLPAVEPDAAQPDVMVADAAPGQPDVASAEAVPPLPQPTEDVAVSLPDVPAPAVATPKTPTSSLYLVVGSFNSTDGAGRMAGRYAALKPQVVRGEAKGNTVYRVVVGPVARSDQAAERRRLASAGLGDAWAMPYTATQVAAAPRAEPIHVAEANVGR